MHYTLLHIVTTTFLLLVHLITSSLGESTLCYQIAESRRYSHFSSSEHYAHPLLPGRSFIRTQTTTEAQDSAESHSTNNTCIIQPSRVPSAPLLLQGTVKYPNLLYRYHVLGSSSVITGAPLPRLHDTLIIASLRACYASQRPTLIAYASRMWNV